MMNEYKWTVADYERMIAVGILTEDDRVELVADGRRIEAHLTRIKPPSV